MKDTPVTEALERLVAPFDGEQGAWSDVLARASRGGRRRKLVTVTVLGFVVVAGLAVMVPFGLAGRIVGLFRDEGKPVSVASLSRADREALIYSMCRRVDLVTHRGRPPEKRCLDGEPTIEEIANNGTRLYWKVSFPSGMDCLASGSVRGYREYGGGRSHIGMIGCGQRLLPTPKRPITVDAVMHFKTGDRRPRVFRVSGLAGEGVATVGLVEKDGDAFKTRVAGRTYVFERPPDREWTAIAAFDDSGDQVYRERLPLGPWPVRTRRRVVPPRRRRLPPLPKQAPLQHAEAPAATVDVYRSGLVAVRFTSTASRGYRLVRPVTSDPRVPISCASVAYGAGQWEELGSGAYGDFGLEMRTFVTMARFSHGAARPPFDVCSVRGTYGQRWNDARGMHDTVEFSFTPLGRRFFAEKAAARDLALFLRTPEMRAIRKAMAREVPTASEISARFPARVVALGRRSQTAPSPAIGVWTDRKQLIIVSRQAEDGRRMFATLRAGRFGPHNLAGLITLLY